MEKDVVKLLEQELELSVDAKTAWTGNYMGHSSTEQGYIRIKAGMTKDATASTLLHEVVHMIFDICGVKESGDEHLVNNLALGIMSFIRNNKQVIEKYIMTEGVQR